VTSKAAAASVKTSWASTTPRSLSRCCTGRQVRQASLLDVGCWDIKSTSGSVSLHGQGRSLRRDGSWRVRVDVARGNGGVYEHAKAANVHADSYASDPKDA
jgi:hypothetical protein